jgi:hypothetical protein
LVGELVNIPANSIVDCIISYLETVSLDIIGQQVNYITNSIKVSPNHTLISWAKAMQRLPVMKSGEI